MTKNYGLNIEKELSEASEKDWIFGAGKPIGGLAENIDFKKYLPKGEVQKGRDDTMDCATRSPNNKIETKLTPVAVLKG